MAESKILRSIKPIPGAGSLVNTPSPDVGEREQNLGLVRKEEGRVNASE